MSFEKFCERKVIVFYQKISSYRYGIKPAQDNRLKSVCGTIENFDNNHIAIWNDNYGLFILPHYLVVMVEDITKEGYYENEIN